ncbi:MAG: hypothetical protein HXK45_04060 [Atopobium sp.]|nr:hypothetical protein [Atopobium sp.]
MTETLGYAISKTWYIVLIFVALAIGIAFLSKKKSSKALVALSALCLVFSVGSFAFGGLTVSEAQSKGASSDQLNSMNLIELVQANQAAPAQTSVNDVNELYNKMVYIYQYGSPIAQSLASDNPFVHHDLPWVAATLPELKKLLDKNEVVYVSTNSQIFKQLHINLGENAVELFYSLLLRSIQPVEFSHFQLVICLVLAKKMAIKSRLVTILSLRFARFIPITATMCLALITRPF